MKNFIRRFIHDDAGAVAFEYCIIFTVMIVAQLSWMAIMNAKLNDAVSDLPGMSD